MSIPTNNWR